MNDGKADGPTLLKELVVKSGLLLDTDDFDFCEKDQAQITEAMRIGGGATIAWALLGFFHQHRHSRVNLDHTEAWLFPERYAERGQRWCLVSPDAERARAIARLEELHPPPPGQRIGFLPKV